MEGKFMGVYRRIRARNSIVMVEVINVIILLIE